MKSISPPKAPKSDPDLEDGFKKLMESFAYTRRSKRGPLSKKELSDMRKEELSRENQELKQRITRMELAFKHFLSKIAAGGYIDETPKSAKEALEILETGAIKADTTGRRRSARIDLPSAEEVVGKTTKDLIDDVVKRVEERKLSIGSTFDLSDKSIEELYGKEVYDRIMKEREEVIDKKEDEGLRKVFGIPIVEVDKIDMSAVEMRIAATEFDPLVDDWEVISGEEYSFWVHKEGTVPSWVKAFKDWDEREHLKEAHGYPVEKRKEKPIDKEFKGKFAGADLSATTISPDYNWLIPLPPIEDGFWRDTVEQGKKWLYEFKESDKKEAIKEAAETDTGDWLDVSITSIDPKDLSILEAVEKRVEEKGPVTRLTEDGIILLAEESWMDGISRDEVHFWTRVYEVEEYIIDEFKALDKK